MSWLESILYGLISGLAEIFPVSLLAHQTILRKLFGADQGVHFCNLLVHIGILAGLIFGCAEQITVIRKESMIRQRRVTGRGRIPGSRSQYDLRLLKTAAVPMIVVMLLYALTRKMEGSSLFLILFLAVNGMLLTMADHMMQANKDSKNMSGLDGILIGILGGLSILPGISRIGASFSIASIRGADRTKALDWCLLLGIPAMIVLCFFDLAYMILLGTGLFRFADFVKALLAGVFSFGGTYLGIWILKRFSARSEFSVFAYYCWGLALFTFVINLIA